jgi:hypothetical protein
MNAEELKLPVGRLALGAIKAGKSAKEATTKVSLLALGAAFELCSELAPEMAEEISDWEDGRKIGIGVLPNGPAITICKEGGKIRFLGASLIDPDLCMYFKNLDSAMLIFTAQIGAAQAVAENRVCLHGSNYQAMQVTRAMAIVQTYLFPGVLLKATFKNAPKLSRKQIATKVKIMGLLAPRLASIVKKG